MFDFSGNDQSGLTQQQLAYQRAVAQQMMQPGQVVNGGGFTSGGGWAGAGMNAIRQALGAYMLNHAGGAEQAQLAQARANGLPYGMGGAQPATTQPAASAGAPASNPMVTALGNFGNTVKAIPGQLGDAFSGLFSGGGQ
jgi:hypothetical protein